MPNQPATPVRSVRMRDELWEALQMIADERGESRSALIVRVLERFAREELRGRYSR